MRMNLSGRIFGRLTALSVERSHPRYDMWRCRCECGVESIARATHLTAGKIRSCGCLMKDLMSETRSTHGCSRIGKMTPEYSVWRGIKCRTRNTRTKSYKNYGGRGIEMCNRWNDFTNFLSDMGPRPSKNHSIDRIDVNGNYEPDNCRWATMKEQMRNTRKSHLISFRGKTQCIAAWADEVGMSQDLVWNRIRYGWSPERALTEPKRRW